MANREMPYYDVEATVRCGDREKPWPQLPHLYFANMEISEDSISAFVVIYGELFRNFRFRRPLRKTMREVMDLPDSEQLSEDLVQVAQETLRKAWDNSASDLAPIAGKADEFTGGPIAGRINPKISVTSAGIELITEDVWDFIRLAFLRDYALGKTAKCPHRACDAEYFLRGKRNQIYCTHRCATLEGAARLRDKVAAAEQQALKMKAPKARNKTKRSS